MRAMAALAVFGMSASGVGAATLGETRAAYNDNVRRLNANPADETPDYALVTPREAVRRFQLGPVRTKDIRRLADQVPLDTEVALRGHLIVSAAEEMTPAAAPRRLRIYGATAGGDAADFVPLDASSLGHREQRLIADHCTVIPCDVTVYGRVGEVEAERVRNFFTPHAEMTVMIGVVAEQARFHEIRR